METQKRIAVRLALAAVGAAALVAAAAGCGGGGGTTTAAASTAVEWADGVCTAVTTWQSSMQSIASGVKANPSKSALTSSVGQAETATKTLATTLKQLGAPQTSAGEQAHESVLQLQRQLTTGWQTIHSALEGASATGGAVAAAATVGTTLATLGQNVSSTVTTLKGLDVKGELGQAFQNADSCTALTS